MRVTDRVTPRTGMGVPSVLPVSAFSLSVDQIARPMKPLLRNWKLWVALGCVGVGAYLLRKKGWR